MPPPRAFGRAVFRVGPIEVAVHSSWFLVLALLVLVARAEIAPHLLPPGSRLLLPLSVGIALLFYGFVFLHELAHALMARAHGLDARRITLFAFGGVSLIDAEAAGPADEFRIVVVGPLASLLIAGVLAAVSLALHPGFDPRSDPGLRLLPGVWGLLSLVNLALALFNLVPAFPLDGGRVLRAALWRATRDRERATRWAATLGRAFAFSLMGAGGAIAVLELVRGGRDTWQGLWYLLLGMFLFNVAGSAGRAEGGPTPRGRVADRSAGPPSGPAGDRAADPPAGYREPR